jgi:hypothetical protein
MKQIATLLLVLVTLSGKTQDMISSNTSVESCNDQKDCITVNGGSYLFFDETRNEFFLKLDFSKFRTDPDTLQNWLNDRNDSLLYYKAILAEEDFPALSNQNTKTLRLNGRIFYAGVWRDQPIDLSIFPTENTIVPSSTSTSNNLRYDNYKLSFSLPFVPKDFKSYKKLYYNNQTVNIAVLLGRIILLRPGMEFHLKEIYSQSTR